MLYFLVLTDCKDSFPLQKLDHSSPTIHTHNLTSSIYTSHYPVHNSNRHHVITPSPACTHPTPPTQQKLKSSKALWWMSKTLCKHRQDPNPPFLTLTCLRGKHRPQQPPKQGWPGHRARHLVSKEQQYQGNRPISQELQTTYKSLHFTSVLYRTISFSSGKKSLLVTLHMLPHLRYKSAVISVCWNTAEKNSNKNPKASKASLRS